MNREAEKKTETPSDWIGKYFYVPDPRDPVTGERLPPGPMRLTELQKRIIDEALSKDEFGNFKYTTVIYSAPKKSGKSAVTSAVALYMGMHNPNSYVACMANDEKQSSARLYLPIYTCFRLHIQYNGPFAAVRANKDEVTLPNYTKIEAVPCDAAGEAGAQPIGVFFCFDEETEILTKAGWKKYDQLSMEDEFLTLAPSGYLEYQKPIDLFISDYTGKMHLLDGYRRSIDLCVTPAHKLYGKFYKKVEHKRQAQYEKKLVEEIPEYTYYGARIESRGIDKQIDVPESILIAGTKRKPPFLMPTELYLELLGWYLSEGCIHKKEAIMIAQSKESNPYLYEEIEELFLKLGYIPHSWRGTDAVIVYDSRLAHHFAQFGLAHEKFIPKWVKALPEEWYDIFFQAYWNGDGFHTSSFDGQIISTNSPQLKDDLMEVAVLHGSGVTCTEYQDKRWGLPVYSVAIRGKEDGEYCVGNHRKYWKEIDYSGSIFCPTVPNGIVCIRRNGKVHFQGQSELWGYQTEKKQRLFVEMTIPPTLYGRAIRWIETYAGYTGESLLLEQLYDVGFTHGEPHPDFLDVQGKFGPAVRVNPEAQMFVYWDTEHRMPWQTPEYYRMEQATMPASEFRRVHGNEWVSSMSSFVEEEWWNACEDKNLPVLNDGDKTPVVVGIDMAVSRDCAALVAVTRSPFNPESEVAVRAVRIFRPSQYGGIIDQEKLIRPVIEDWHSRWNVVCWVYDPKEMAKLAQDMTREGVGWFKAFGQVQPRTVSDKQLHDMILAKQIAWNSQSTFGDVGFRGDNSEKDTLYRHIVQAGATTTGDAYRLEKLSASAKIDGAVALSQAAFTALRLAISNMEFNQTSLIKLLASGQITLEEFSRRVQHAHPELVEARQG